MVTASQNGKKFSYMLHRLSPWRLLNDCRAVLLPAVIVVQTCPLHAQTQLAPTVLTQPVNLTPNGTVDMGVVPIDDRGMSVLLMSPQIVTFSQIGQSQQMTVQMALTDFSTFDPNLSVYGITFVSSSPAVASVSPTGLVTAVSSGTTLVTAAALGQTVQSIVVVDPGASVTSLAIAPPSMSFGEVGAQQQLQVSALLSSGFSSDVTSQSSTTYVSSNSGVATVGAGGLVTAVGAGTAVITTSYAGVSSTAAVSVSISAADQLSGLTLTAPTSVIRSTSPVQLTATGELSGGGTTDLTSSAAGTIYSVTPSSVAAVSASGALTPLAAGSAVVTAQNSSFEAQAPVTVSFSPLAAMSLSPPSANLV